MLRMQCYLLVKEPFLPRLKRVKRQNSQEFGGPVGSVLAYDCGAVDSNLNLIGALFREREKRQVCLVGPTLRPKFKRTFLNEKMAMVWICLYLHFSYGIHIIDAHIPQRRTDDRLSPLCQLPVGPLS